jgi:hypothetical protein
MVNLCEFLVIQNNYTQLWIGFIVIAYQCIFVAITSYKQCINPQL